jgi:hypothetical protein
MVKLNQLPRCCEYRCRTLSLPELNIKGPVQVFKFSLSFHDKPVRHIYEGRASESIKAESLLG